MPKQTKVQVVYLIYKQKIIECTQWLSRHGYFGACRGTGGNVSMRIEGESAFAITPSTMPYDELTPDDICILDFDQQPIMGEKKPSGIESVFINGRRVLAKGKTDGSILAGRIVT